MSDAFEAEVAAVVGWVEATDLSADAKNSLMWCLNQLPALARDFGRTYESRYTDQVLRLEQGMLGKVAEENAAGLAEALIERLRALHERLGLPGVDPKLRPAPPPLPRKKRKAG